MMMNKIFILNQLKTGPKTARDIARSYCDENPDKYYSTFSSAKKQLAVLAKQGYVKRIGTVTEEIWAEKGIKDSHYSTVKMILWAVI